MAISDIRQAKVATTEPPKVATVGPPEETKEGENDTDNTQNQFTAAKDNLNSSIRSNKAEDTIKSRFPGLEEATRAKNE